MANINSVITYNANLSAAQAQLKALTGQVGALTAAFNTLDKSALAAQRSLAAGFATNVGQIGGFTAQTVKATDATTNFGKQLAANRLSMREYFREAITGYRKVSQMRKLAEQQVRYQQSVAVPTGAGQAMMLTPTAIDSMASKTALASQRFSIFNQLVDGGATKMLNWGKNTQWAGRQLMVGFTMPLMLFTAVASKQFRDLDKELTRFQKVYGSDLGNSVSDTTQRMRENIKQLAFDISRTYGIAAKETAALAADIAATGAEGEKLISSVQQTTRLAVLGEVDRQEAMKATLALQSAFKMNTNELAESINFLNAVENQTSATLEDLATAIPKVGPVVRSLGGDIEDLATLLVAMREGGIPAAEAANALKSGLASLINPTKQASIVAQQFGVDLAGIVTANKGQLMPTIYAVQEALSGLDNFSRSRIIEQIFGKYQFARITALFDNIGRVGSQTQSVIELATKSSAELAAVANGEIRTLTESTAVKFQRSIENLKNSIIPLGQALTETLIPVFETIGKVMGGLQSFFQALPEPIKGFTKLSIAIAAVAGPIIMLVGLFGNLIANGIKFSMGIARIGAKLAGLKFGKFELLDEITMAAKLGVDNLSLSFTNQQTALNKLNAELIAYQTSLSRLTRNNPALFIPGAIPRGGAMPIAPIKRQVGSQTPERIPGGYGGGDKVPALLEPGEMVVRKEAAAQYGPIIAAMNRGNVVKLAQGDQRSHVSSPMNIQASQLVQIGGLTATVEKMMRMLGNQIVTLYSNLTLQFSTLVNQRLKPLDGKPGRVAASTLSQEIASKKSWEDIMKKTGLSFAQLQPVIQSVTGKLNDLGNELIDDPKLYAIVEKSIASLAAKSDTAALALQTLSRQYGTFRPTAEQAALLRTDPQFGYVSPKSTVRLGEGIAPPYNTPRTGTGVPLQNMRYYDFGSGSKSIQPMQPPISTPTTLTAKPVGGIESITTAKKIALAQKSILSYEKKREELLARRNSAERQIAINNGEIAKITANSKLTLDQKIKLWDQINLESKKQRDEIAITNANLARLDRNIISAKERHLSAVMMTGGYFGGINPYAAGSKTGPSTTIMPVAGSRFGNLTDEQKRQLAAEKRVARGFSAERPGDLRRAFATAAGPTESLRTAKENAQMGGMRGQGAMNAAFMVSMLVSSFSMVSGSSQEVAGKLALLSTAVMAASTAMMMFSGKNVAGNFLGLGSLGGAVTGAGVAQRGAARTAMGGATAARAAGGIGRTGAGLIQAGSVLSTLGGPAGMAAAAGITALVGGIILYKKSIEDAEAKAVSAFVEPAKSAEFFGKTIRDISQELKDDQIVVPGLEEINQGLRDAVKQDYGILIDKIRFGSAEAGARELSLAFNKMIASGLSAEDAKAAVQAIAIEAGAVGGESFAKAMRQGMLTAITPADVAENTAKLFDVDLMKENADAIQVAINNLDKGFQRNVMGNIAQLLDNSILGVDLKSLPFFMSLPGLISGIFTDIDDKVSQQITGMAAYSNNMEQLMANLAENLDVSSGQIVSIVETLYSTFKEAPEETMQAFDDISQAALDLSNIPFDPVPIQEFLNTLDPIAAITLNPLIQDNENLALVIMKAVTAGMSLQEILKSLQNDSLEADIELTVRVATQEVELNELKQSVSDKITEELDAATEEVDANIEGINKKIERLGKVSERHIGVLTKEFNKSQRGSESLIESLEDQSEAIQDNIDAKREDFEERMQDLEDERDAIEEGADAYVNSLEKKSKADSFYSQQRKTSLSALQKLASGDVFGFLQERQQMSQDSQQFSYDEQINGIEERRDLELDAIDETMEKERRKQEEFEKNEKARIDAINDQISAERDLMDERQKSFDRTVRIYERQVKKKETALKDELTAEQGHRSALEKLRGGEIKSQQDLYKTLNEASANYYMEQQKRILKEQMSLEIGRVLQKYPDITFDEAVTRAYGNIKPMFDAMYERKGVGMNFMQGDLAAVGYVYSTDGRYTGSTAGGNTGGRGPRPPGQNNPGFDVTKYDSKYPQTRVGRDGITYVWNGDRYVPQYASGGKVRGPGGPKSDSIPAMLSNGEYVIQASSVDKYGPELMDTINAGKYADGGIVGFKNGSSNPTWYSADRAEQAATGTRGTPKPQYSGGTPTYSGGYTSANTQGTRTSGYKSKIWKQPKVKTGFGFLGDMFFEGIRSDFADFINTSILGNQSAELQNLVGMNISGNRSYGQRSELDQAIGNALFAMNFIPGIGIPMLGAKMGAKTASSLGRSMVGVQSRTGMNIGPAQTTARRASFDTLLEEKYGDAMIGHLIRLGDSPNAGVPAGLRLESSINPAFTNPISTWMDHYALTGGAKQAVESMSSYGGIKPIRVVHGIRIRNNIDAAISAINKAKQSPGASPGAMSAEFDSQPFNLISRLSAADPEFAALSIGEKREVLGFLRTNGFQLDSSRNLAFNSGGFDAPYWNSGQINMAFPSEGKVNLLSTIAHELGHTTDFATSRSGYGDPIGNRLKLAMVYGRTEAFAESNKLRSTKEILEDINADPEDLVTYTQRGGGVAPYQVGVRPGGYANSPLFKIAYAMQMRHNMKGNDALFDISGFSMRNSGIYSDIIKSTPQWLLQTAMARANRAAGWFTGNPAGTAMGTAMRPAAQAQLRDSNSLFPTNWTPTGTAEIIDEGIRDITAGQMSKRILSNPEGIRSGATPGGYFMGADGIRRYVKGHGNLEAPVYDYITSRLFSKLGVPVPRTTILRTPSNKQIKYSDDRRDIWPTGSVLTASDIMPGTPANYLTDATLKRIGKQSLQQYQAADNVIGLTDMHGANYLIQEDGTAIRVDFGGNPWTDAKYGNLRPTDSHTDLNIPGGWRGRTALTAKLYPQLEGLKETILAQGGFEGMLSPILQEILTNTGLKPAYPQFISDVYTKRMQQLFPGFADGGLAVPDKGLFGILSKVPGKEKAPMPGTTGMPGTGAYGQPTGVQPTSTNLIGHPSQGGPNSWPYQGYPTGSGKIPGTNVNASLNKDVLPLFLAFLSDYNRLIRPISTLGGIEYRDGNYSNHPSGTAVDINSGQEGVYFGWDWVSTAQKLAVLDWWKGRTSSLAPWKSNSPVPYRTMNALINKYKVLQWFGPRSLGGFITDEMGNSDPMHVQITQSRTVTPKEVSSTISSLGINPDGTFNRPSTYAAGGFISGPGGPRSDIIPAMLSNGEYVVKASSVAKYGKGFMDQINAGQFGMGGLVTTAPRMVSPAQYAGGGFVGSMSGATPTFGVPQMESINPSSMNANIANSYGGSNRSSVRNSSKVNIVINGAGGKSTNAIANKVISMINQANGRRNHSRSAG